MYRGSRRPTTLSAIRRNLRDGLAYPWRSDRRWLLLALGGTYLYLAVVGLVVVAPTVLPPRLLASPVFVELLFNALGIPVYCYLVRIVQWSLRRRRRPPALDDVGSLSTLVRLGLKTYVIWIVLTVVTPNILSGYITGPLTGVVTSLVAAGYRLLLFGGVEGPDLGVVADLFALAVSWYLTPAVLIAFARRERLSDLLEVDRYRNVFTDPDYVRSIVVPLLLLVAVQTVVLTIIVTGVYYAATSLAGDGLSVSALGAGLLAYLSTIAEFYVLLSMYRVMAHEWWRVRDDGEGPKLDYDPTRQLRLDSFGE